MTKPCNAKPLETGHQQVAPSIRWALASLSLSTLLSSLGTSIATVALPTLSQQFHATFQAVQWIVLAYLLATTILIVSIGRIGDIFGRRRVFLAGIVVFTLASIFCGVAPNLELLVAARAVQGLGAAVLTSLSMALAVETAPRERTGSAMGLLGTMSALGTALGPSLGGLLIAGLGWRSIFLINVPVGFLAFHLARQHLPKDSRVRRPESAGADSLGTLLLALTLGAYALALTTGRGQFSLPNLVLLMAATCGLGLFVVTESMVASPLLKLSMFRDPQLSSSLAMSAIVSTVMMATLVVGPFHLSRSLRLDETMVGLALSAGPIAAAVTGIFAGRLADRYGTIAMTLVGLSGIASGSLALAIMPVKPGVSGYLTPIVIITVGYALFQAANNTSVMSNIAPDQRGVISGMLNLFRNLGLITGASFMGAVFALGSGGSDISMAHADPDAIATGMRVTFAVAVVLTMITFAISIGVQLLAKRNTSAMKAS